MAVQAGTSVGPVVTVRQVLPAKGGTAGIGPEAGTPGRGGTATQVPVGTAVHTPDPVSHD